MIKKLLFTTGLIFTIGIANIHAQASCTPDFSCLPGTATEGICPDSTTGLPAGTMGAPYNTTVSIKIPSSTVSGGTTYTLNQLALTDVTIDTSGSGTYVPLSSIGLTYLGSGSNTPSSGSGISGYTMTKFCYWPAPSGACAVVSGTPTKAGNFPVRIISQARVIIFGFPTWIAAPDNNQYHLLVNVAAGIETLDLTKLDMNQNTPNPFYDKTEIRFSSVNQTNVEFKVFNMLGAVVYNSEFTAEKGVNKITIESNSFAPGVYVYSIKNGDKTITKRMIVSK